MTTEVVKEVRRIQLTGRNGLSATVYPNLTQAVVTEELYAPRSCSPELFVTLSREEALYYYSPELTSELKNSKLPSPYHLRWIQRAIEGTLETATEDAAVALIKSRLRYIK